jgi:HEAT repeat protein
MAAKMPRVTIEELDGLVEQLGKNEAKLREAALVRLTDFERTGRMPLQTLLDLSQSDHPSLSMYAITALGRNGEPGAVRRLIELAERHRAGNVLFLEQIIDALGETRSPAACGVLLGLLGIRSGWSGKLFAWRGRKEGDDAEANPHRAQITLPVLRALAKIADPKAAALLEDYLSHPDPLVRWHAIQNLLAGNVKDRVARLREMAAQDANDLVREAAAIAVERFEPLPPNLNN